MLKRIFCALLAMLLLTGAALGESLMSFEDYAAALDALADAEWTADGDMRTLELADEATVSVCLEDENVMAVTVEAPKGSIMDAGSAALKALGAMTDAEIAELLDMTEAGSAEVDACAFWRMLGKKREGIAVCAAEDAPSLFWIPVHGGKKFHVRMGCSGMDVARLVTQKAAEEAGLEPCGRCKNR